VGATVELIFDPRKQIVSEKDAFPFCDDYCYLCRPHFLVVSVRYGIAIAGHLSGLWGER
jgi:hypothetical protein